MLIKHSAVHRMVITCAATALLITATHRSQAGPKEECVEAHGRAQDLRERGQLSRARQLFVTCAQNSCPLLVQQDCARFSEELAQFIPSVTFGARDAAALDLPLTSVYVDDVLLATRLDDGHAYELDPGKHTVRFVHEGKETTLKVVLNQGERGRLIVASFVDKAGSSSRDAHEARLAVETEPPSTESRRSLFPLVLTGLGTAAAVTGGVVYAVGSSSLPSTCSMDTRECAAAPGSPAFGRAESSVRTSNLGLEIGISGAVALVSGLVWYFAQPTTRGSDPKRAARPSGVFTF